MQCVPLCTYTQGAWGNAGGAPGTNMDPPTTDLVVITTLLANHGPLVVGGGNRSLALTSAPCIVTLLPGNGNPGVLANCHQTNCTGCNPTGSGGRLKNNLATQVIALHLNVWLNVEYKLFAEADVLDQELDCIAIPSSLVWCNPVCSLRVVSQNGTQYVYPYTIGGLLGLANLYLGGNIQLTSGASSAIAGALTTAVGNVNEYWDECEAGPCLTPPTPIMAPNDGGNDYFTVSKQGLSVRMDWVVQNNPDVAHFVIERSTDGESFTLLSEKNAKDGQVPLYTDKDGQPNDGENYYRVLVVKKNGESYYLPTRKALVQSAKPFAVYPNPARDEVFVNLERIVGSEATLVMYDFLAQEVYRKHFDEISEPQLRISLEGFHGGMYVVYVEYAEGPQQQRVAVKFLVERE